MKRPCGNKRNRLSGQGLIEYAGALVMAAMLVASALAVLPDNFVGTFDRIWQAANDMMISALEEM